MVKETLANGLLHDSILVLIVFCIIGTIILSILYVFFRLTIYKFIVKPSYHYIINYFHHNNSNSIKNLSK
jgi:hypothetical protein